MPDDWKLMRTIGSGVQEIRVRTESGAFRIVYLANRTEAVHVLHAFQKRTEKTAQRDIGLALERYRSLMEMMP